MMRTFWKVPKKFFNVSELQKAVLPKLDYNYEDLEPVLSKEIVEIHHTKHHQAYIDNYNRLIPQLQEAISKGETEKIVNLTKDIKFNGGSHINHSIYWKNLAPIKSNFLFLLFLILDGGGKVLEKDSPLMKEILAKWKNVENFQNDFTDLLMKIQGSGYANLVYCKTARGIHLMETKDQDPVSMVPGKVPILGIDAWEHSWYLKYKNEKKKYATEIWKIVNWGDMEKRYKEAL